MSLIMDFIRLSKSIVDRKDIHRIRYDEHKKNIYIDLYSKKRCKESPSYIEWTNTTIEDFERLVTDVNKGTSIKKIQSLETEINLLKLKLAELEQSIMYLPNGPHFKEANEHFKNIENKKD